MEMKLEVVPLPVADIDRAKAFYVEKVGFHADFDMKISETKRIVQLTPQGSGCSILLSMGLDEISEMTPGSLKGLHLVVKDIRAVRETLTARGVEVSEIEDMGRNVLMASFRDPDGNLWALQELPPDLRSS